jgi:hypothetical protein
MRANPARLLQVAAAVEVVAGAGLLLAPGLGLDLLLGVRQAPAETLLAGRVLGAALLSIAASLWLTRNHASAETRRGLVGGFAVYTVLAAALLGYAGAGLGMAGPALWPAALLHAALALWCGLCLAGPSGAR